MNELLKRLIDSLSTAQICWSCALIAMGGISYGVKTYASNSVVASLRIEITQARIEILEKRVFDLRVNQCLAMKAGQPSVVYREELGRLLRQYYERTSVAYPIPDCAEL